MFQNVILMRDNDDFSVRFVFVHIKSCQNVIIRLRTDQQERFAVEKSDFFAFDFSGSDPAVKSGDDQNQNESGGCEHMCQRAFFRFEMKHQGANVQQDEIATFFQENSRSEKINHDGAGISRKAQRGQSRKEVADFLPAA